MIRGKILCPAKKKFQVIIGILLTYFLLFKRLRFKQCLSNNVAETDLFEIMNNSEDENVLYIHPSTHKY